MSNGLCEHGFHMGIMVIFIGEIVHRTMVHSPDIVDNDPPSYRAK